MKIIAVDNFDREYISDRLVAESVPPTYAEEIVEFLNSRYSGDHAQVFFKAVADDHKLFKFEP